MKLNEITKDEFLNKLKDPLHADVKQQCEQFRKHIKNMGWGVSLTRLRDKGWRIEAGTTYKDKHTDNIRIEKEFNHYFIDSGFSTIHNLNTFLIDTRTHYIIWKLNLIR